MRRRHRRSTSGSIDSTPESRYARIRTAGWLMRILDKQIVVNSDLLNCAFWCLGRLDFCLHGLLQEAQSSARVSNLL
jgi:hypothetical protein